jgi:hypothetical protein
MYNTDTGCCSAHARQQQHSQKLYHQGLSVMLCGCSFFESEVFGCSLCSAQLVVRPLEAGYAVGCRVNNVRVLC